MTVITLATPDGEEIAIVDMSRVSLTGSSGRAGEVTTVKQNDPEFGATIVTYNGQRISLREAVVQLEMRDGRDYGAIEAEETIVAGGSGGASVTSRTIVDFGR